MTNSKVYAKILRGKIALCPFSQKGKRREGEGEGERRRRRKRKKEKEGEEGRGGGRGGEGRGGEGRGEERRGELIIHCMLTISCTLSFQIRSTQVEYKTQG
jgi:hypothetical protein